MFYAEGNLVIKDVQMDVGRWKCLDLGLPNCTLTKLFRNIV